MSEQGTADDGIADMSLVVSLHNTPLLCPVCGLALDGQQWVAFKSEWKEENLGSTNLTPAHFKCVLDKIQGQRA